jgi:hypothetical protein
MAKPLPTQAVKPRSKYECELKALIPLYGLTIIIARNSERMLITVVALHYVLVTDHIV